MNVSRQFLPGQSVHVQEERSYLRGAVTRRTAKAVHYVTDDAGDSHPMAATTFGRFAGVSRRKTKLLDSSNMRFR